MPDPRQLTSLIKLLDDDSATVRESVLRELGAFGPDLELELARQNVVLGNDDLSVIKCVLEEQRAVWLKEAWPDWFTIDDDKEKLESALSLLAQFMHGRAYHVSLHQLIERLAEEYITADSHGDARRLACFLFDTTGLKGVHQEEYYNPLNSSLIHVIEQKRGLPISLACVYILVGNRLGLNVEGINLPGHFLAKCESGGRSHIIDCYNGGRFLNEEDLASVQTQVPITMQNILSLECRSSTIIARVLRNLVNACQYSLQDGNSHLMFDLLTMMERIDFSSSP